jgi:uracil-DNA glycosylase
MYPPCNDRPKLLRDSEAREARRAQLSEPHIAPLSAFVASLREELGPLAHVPDFDPWDGGTQAEVLFLLEAPGGRAVSSGFVSRNNPDETARNFFEMNCAAGIPRGRTVTWNIIPWYLGSGTKIRPATQRDIHASADALRRLLALLPRLTAVVLIGRAAEKAIPSIRRLRPVLRIFVAPHPSPLFVNNKPGNRDRIIDVLREVAAVLRDRDPAV